MSRPEIIEITVKVELPKSGKIQTISVRPDALAVFFHEKAVKEILGPFYKKNKGHKLRRSTSVKLFGKKITDALFVGSTSTSGSTAISITDTVVEQIWNTEDEYGHTIPLLVKTPPCIIE
jgi:hypothetical protein